MSTNHRTRIKSVADYSKNLTDIGACCYPNADAAVEEYYNTCLDKNGHWQPFDNDVSEISCPDLGATGCCCSCSYVDDFTEATGFFGSYAPGVSICGNVDDDQYPYPCYQGGLKNDVSFCECNAKGGVWAQGVDCDVYTETDINGLGQEYVIFGSHALCTRGGDIDDVRWPGACCSGITCSDACSTKECMENSQSLGIFSGISFLPDNYCNLPTNGDGDVVIDCDSLAASGYVGDESNFEKDNRTGVWVAKRNFNDILNSDSSTGSKSKIYSSCVYLTKGSSYKLQCNQKTKSVCKDLNGMWAGYDESNQPLTETDNVTVDIKSFVENKKKISQSSVDSWNIGDRVLNLGRFVGEFYVKDSTRGIGVDCIGSELTGKSYNYRPQSEDNTTSSGKSFAIIIADADYNHQRVSPNGWSWENNSNIKNTKESSTWDSVYNDSYNSHLSLMKNIDKLYANPWIKWTPPTKDQLAFINMQTNNLDFISNTTIEDKSPNARYISMQGNDSVFYWSSSFFGGINYDEKTQLAYCQSFGLDPMVVLSPRDKNHLVRLISAIEIM